MLKPMVFMEEREERALKYISQRATTGIEERAMLKTTPKAIEIGTIHPEIFCRSSRVSGEKEVVSFRISFSICASSGRIARKE